MPQILKNNVSGVLNGSITAAATSLTLLDASNFPDPGTDYYLLTLIGLNGNGQEASWEIVKVTSKASNTLTVVRAQEGTTAQAWASATTVQMRLTAASVAKSDHVHPFPTAANVGAEPAFTTLGVAKGGTGATTLTGILKGNGTGAFTAVTAPTGTIVGTTDSQTLTNKTFTGYTETVFNLTGTDISPANGTIQYKTLTANTTFTESLADGQSVILMLNPSTFAATWPTITWIGSAASTAPTLVASVYNCITFFQFAGTLYGKYEGRV